MKKSRKVISRFRRTRLSNPPLQRNLKTALNHQSLHRFTLRSGNFHQIHPLRQVVGIEGNGMGLPIVFIYNHQPTSIYQTDACNFFGFNGYFRRGRIGENLNFKTSIFLQIKPLRKNVKGKNRFAFLIRSGRQRASSDVGNPQLATIGAFRRPYNPIGIAA